jgi:hypothetical protein
VSSVSRSMMSSTCVSFSLGTNADRLLSEGKCWGVAI